MSGVHRAVWMVAFLAMGCGESAATGETPSEPAEPSAASSSARGSRSNDFDPSLPEYQGDHSLPGDATAGEAVYRANCLACHGADGTGNRGLTGADFVNDRRRLARNNDVLMRSIRDGLDGSPAMPPHRDILTDEQMRDALAYVRSTFGSTAQ